MIRRLLFLFTLITILALPASAQFTTASATVPVLPNATYTFDFVNLSGGGPPLLGGISVFPTQVVGSFDSSGHFSAPVADNNQVLPLPSQWKLNITFCKGAVGLPPGGSLNFSIQQTLTGPTVDLTAALTAALPPNASTCGTGGGGSGRVGNCNKANAMAYYPTAEAAVACDPKTSDDGAGNQTSQSLNTSSNSIANPTTTNYGAVPARLCIGASMNAGSTDLTSSCTTFLPTDQYARVGAEGLGEIDSTVTFVSSTHLTTSDAWPGANQTGLTIYVGMDSGPAIQACVTNMSNIQGQCNLPCGVYLSSIPLAQNAQTGLFMSGANKDCVTIQYVGKAAAPALTIGQVGGNSPQKLSNLTIHGNKYSTIACAAEGSVQSTFEDLRCEESNGTDGMAFYTVNCVGVTLINLITQTSIYTIQRARHGWVFDGSGSLPGCGPTVLIGGTMELAFGNGIWQKSGGVKYIGIQVSTNGVTFQQDAGFAEWDESLWESVDMVNFPGVVNILGNTQVDQGNVPIHVFSGGVATLHDGNFNFPVTADAGSHLTIRGANVGQLIDNSQGAWIDGPNLDGGNAGAQSQFIPQYQHVFYPTVATTNAESMIDLGGSFQLQNCTSYPSNCTPSNLATPAYAAGRQWKMVFDGVWNIDLTVPNPMTLIAGGVTTISVAGRTINVVQSASGVFQMYSTSGSAAGITFFGKIQLYPDSAGTPSSTFTSLTTTGACPTAATFTGGVLNIPSCTPTAITLTTTGTSGAATLTGTVLNIPVYTPSGSGFPITLGSTSIAASSTTTSIAGLTLTSPTFVTPALGTPASGVATSLTGLPLTTGVTGVLPVSNGGNGTATPTLGNGTGISISGSWPGYTINVAVIAPISTTIGTITLSANTCSASAITATMPGVTNGTTTFEFTAQADITAVTGWGSTGGLNISPWATLNTLNYRVCNPTANSITTSSGVTFTVNATNHGVS